MALKKKKKKVTKKPIKIAKRNKIKVVMDEFKAGELRSGSKSGPQVTNPKQAIAIALSESRRLKKKPTSLKLRRSRKRSK